MILVTGATGKLGHWVVQGLLQKGVGAGDLAVLARDPDKASDLAARGISVRPGDYSDPASLEAAFAGVKQLMFVSSNELGARAPKHKKVIAAAKKSGVKHVVYTSILNADTSPMELASDHKETEAALRQSGLSFTLLRNGWYFENYTENMSSALEYGALLGAAKDGRYAFATRQDYAEAAVAVLTSSKDESGKVYELGGKPSATLSELAAEISRQAEKTPVAYVDLEPTEFEERLKSFGLPPFLAHLLADADAAAQKGFLDTSSGDLERLLGRPATTLSKAVEAGLGL